MTLTPKPCTCTITLPTPEYNKMVEYIKKLENAIKNCDNCIGCEAIDDSVITNSPCSSWVWNGVGNETQRRI